MARYVTTDLHGCLHTFQHLVEKVLRLRPQDELYLLGDYVNKGPDSRGLLDYLMQLPQRGYQVHIFAGHSTDIADAAWAVYNASQLKTLLHECSGECPGDLLTKAAPFAGRAAAARTGLTISIVLTSARRIGPATCFALVLPHHG